MHRNRLLSFLTRTHIFIAGTTHFTDKDKLHNKSISDNDSTNGSNEPSSSTDESTTNTNHNVKSDVNNSKQEVESCTIKSKENQKNDESISETGKATTKGPQESKQTTTTSNDCNFAKATERRSFREITIQPWQKLMIDNTTDHSIIPSKLLFFGTHLGPRPLIILDHSLPDPAMKYASNMESNKSEDSNYCNMKVLESNNLEPMASLIKTTTKSIRDDNDNSKTNKVVNSSEVKIENKEVMLRRASQKYEPMLSHLTWDHGILYIPLWLDASSLYAPNLLYNTCRMVCGVLDAFDVQWSHFLTYSYGTLVAARLMASRYFLHRIGTLMSLDSPLVTEQIVHNATLREEIHAAEEDVNIPESELTFAKEQLLSNLENGLPCAAKDDQLLFDKYFFNHERNFSRGGLDYDEHRFVPVRELRKLHHPIQFITPSNNSIVDSKLHKEFFQLRRLASIKTANNHEDLFHHSSAKEVASVVDAWMQRFEPDEIIQRRYIQAAKELEELITSNSSNVYTDSMKLTSESQPRKKKEKKKKIM